MDTQTSIEKDGGERKRRDYAHSTIKGAGELIVRLTDAVEGFQEPNLALLGTYQKPVRADLVSTQSLRIKHETKKAQTQFEASFNKTKNQYNVLDWSPSNVNIPIENARNVVISN